MNKHTFEALEIIRTALTPIIEHIENGTKVTNIDTSEKAINFISEVEKNNSILKLINNQLLDLQNMYVEE